MTDWVFLSPHLDDAVLSSGGWIYERTCCGDRIEIWTIFAGDVPAGQPLTPFAEALHARWNLPLDAPAARRAEDIQAAKVVGASAIHLEYPDCIYRRTTLDGEAVIGGEEDLMAGQVSERESNLPAQIAEYLSDRLPQDVEVVSPLTLGGHVDHCVTRAAAELLGRRIWYYADYPYVVRNPQALAGKLPAGAQVHTIQLSDAALLAWQDGVAAYESQISTFWKGAEAMRAALQMYEQQGGGKSLWTLPFLSNYFS